MQTTAWITHLADGAARQESMTFWGCIEYTAPWDSKRSHPCVRPKDIYRLDSTTRSPNSAQSERFAVYQRAHYGKWSACTRERQEWDPMRIRLFMRCTNVRNVYFQTQRRRVRTQRRASGSKCINSRNRTRSHVGVFPVGV